MTGIDRREELRQATPLAARSFGTRREFDVNGPREDLHSIMGSSPAANHLRPDVPPRRKLLERAMKEATGHPEEFRDAFEYAFERLQSHILAVCLEQGEWPNQVAAGIRAAFEFASDDVAAARVLACDSMMQGKAGLDLYDRMIEAIAARLEPGRAEHPDGSWLPEITEKALVGGSVTLVARNIERGDQDRLPAMVPETIQFVLTPYVGAERARTLAMRYGA